MNLPVYRSARTKLRDKRVKRVLIGVGAVLIALAMLPGCSKEPTDVVDGKAQIPVVSEDGKTTLICNLLEVETEDFNGNEIGEGYVCVSKPEWDRNRVGEPWVDANGTRR